MKSVRKRIKDENYIDFGQWLYELRESKGYSEYDLVELIGIDYVQVKNIKKWERDLEFPDLDSMYKLSEIYMIPSAEIIERKNQTLKNGIDGINIYLVRIISFIVGVPLYGAVAFYYITNVLAYVAVIIAFVWFHNIVFNR